METSYNVAMNQLKKELMQLNQEYMEIALVKL